MIVKVEIKVDRQGCVWCGEHRLGHVKHSPCMVDGRLYMNAWVARSNLGIHDKWFAGRTRTAAVDGLVRYALRPVGARRKS